MQRLLIGFLILSAANAVASAAAAQTRDPAIGARIRFRPTRGAESRTATAWTEGHVVRTGLDTMVVRRCASCRDSSLTPLTAFEIQRHRGVGSRGKNAGVGALAGAAVGLGVVFHDISACEARPNNDLCGVGIILAPVFAGGGAVAGALVGAIVAPWWEPFYSPPHASHASH